MMRVHAILLVAIASSPEEHTVAAYDAAVNAQHAASVATDIAAHSAFMHTKAQEALSHASGAVEGASLDTKGLSSGQKEALDKAHNALAEATQKLEADQLKQAAWLKEVQDEEASAKLDAATVKSFENQIAELEKKVSGEKSQELLNEYNEELDALREKLGKAKAIQEQDEGAGESIGKLRDELAQMEQQLETMESIEHLRANINHAEAKLIAKTAALRAELKEMEAMLKAIEDKGEDDSTDTKALDTEVKKLKAAVAHEIAEEEAAATSTAAPVESDTSEEPSSFKPVGDMPYGDLAPFGREDTARELTEASIRESDKMVDQLERAEVAEEKRAVFRSLTRLRGAAITSFDGVARSQTGNIDEYTHTHQWRRTHPLHHLAQDESDVSKWAFPNVD